VLAGAAAALAEASASLLLEEKALDDGFRGTAGTVPLDEYRAGTDGPIAWNQPIAPGDRRSVSG